MIPRFLLNQQVSNCADVIAGPTQRSNLHPLLLLIYIIDLVTGLSSLAKRFANGCSVFSVAHNIKTSAKKFNYLAKISNLAFQWKKTFNPNPSKHAQEIILRQMLKETSHPLFFLNNI